MSGNTVTGTDTNKPLPREPATGLTGSGNTTTTGPHSSSLENRLDPRVDSASSRGFGNTTGNSELGSNTSGYGSSTGHTSIPSGYGSSTGPTSTTGLASNTSGYGSSMNPMGSSTTGATTTSGPHSSSVENRLDPRVDSNNSRGVGNTTGTTGFGPSTSSGYGSGTAPMAGSTNQGSLAGNQPHLGRDAALGTGAATGVASGAQSWEHVSETSENILSIHLTQYNRILDHMVINTVATLMDLGKPLLHLTLLRGPMSLIRYV